MKAVILLLLRRRWYLFLSLMITVFMMTALVWNEVGPYIKSRPYINQLEKYANQSVYEVLYLPRAEEDGLIVANKQSEKVGLYNLFQEYFYREGQAPSLYLGKTAYLSETTTELAKHHLIPVMSDSLESEIFKDYLDIMFVDSLLVKGREKSELELFSKQANSYGYSIRFQSLKKKYQQVLAYYRNNLIFGLATSAILFVFTLALTYWIVTAGFKICQTELRVLRVIGVSRKTIRQIFSISMLFPLLLVSTLFIGAVTAVGIGLTALDLVCVLGVNLLLSLVVWWCVHRATREVFND